MAFQKTVIYPLNFEEKIGFSTIREQCVALCTMQHARELLGDEGFTANENEIRHRHALAEEMRQILLSEREAPTDEFYDIAEIVEKAKVEGTFLEVTEVVQLGKALISAGDFVQFLHKSDTERYPALTSLAKPVKALWNIVADIRRIVDDKGIVRDGASEELRQIRAQIRRHEGQVSKRLQAILQLAKSSGIVDVDASISIREGRAVIPVSASNKRKLNGFIHDESATGKTFYVEPAEVVELNNMLRELEYEERREIVRILTAFTDVVRADIKDVERTEAFMAVVDMVRAKARWAVENGAGKPIISEDNHLRLHTAKHPLLAQSLKRHKRTIIPLDVELDTERRIMVISGPNAGGKSVCLKTIGLLQYMFQCGFPITASEMSELPIFNKIYINIGDEQSIDNDLSTYSSHLLNMKAMVAGADKHTMVLIDEFGSGTEPVIGSAIAEAILEKLVASGCFGVITTHYSNIKYFASNNEGVINGAMMFDVQNIRPLFRLECGKPGSSFAIEIARKIGLPEDIIASAKEKAGSEHIDLEKQLREVARDKHYWAQKRERIRQTDRKVEEMEQALSEKLSNIREERNRIIHEAKAQAKELVAEANRQIENTIKGIREAQAEKEQTKLLRREFEEFREEIETDNSEANERIEREMERLRRRQQRREERKNNPAEKKQEQVAQPIKKSLPLEVGAKVRMFGQNGVGIVKEVRGKRAQVAFGAILTTVETARLEVISSAEFKRMTRPETPRTVISADISQRRLNFRSQIDIRGERVMEALEQVQDLVDDALMVGVSTITILHGKGTGALKEEVRRYLRSLPQVASATDDHPDRGGSGITIVTFKE